MTRRFLPPDLDLAIPVCVPLEILMHPMTPLGIC